jgi:hypothetical protein
VTVKATKVSMVRATKVVGNKEGDGDSDGAIMGDDDGDEGDGPATATRVIAMATAMI